MPTFSRFPLLRSILSLAAVTLVVSAVPVVQVAMASPPGRSPLPVLLASADAQPAGFDAAFRTRVVAIDTDGLAALVAGRRIELNLFDDVSFVASVKPMATAGAWSGTIVGETPGFITVVKREGLVAASIRVPGAGTYRIRPVADGAHIVEEIDEAAQSPCGFGAEHAVIAPEAVDDPPPPAVAGGGMGPVKFCLHSSPPLLH